MWRRRNPDTGQVWEEFEDHEAAEVIRRQNAVPSRPPGVRLEPVSAWRIDVFNVETGAVETPLLRESNQLDDRDAAILAKRWRMLDEVESIRCGDFVSFADGVLRRASHLWDDSVQTSDGGRYYLGEGHISMSGSLHDGVSRQTLTRTSEYRLATVWFFHHNQRRSHNGVDVQIPFRVYQSDQPTEDKFCARCEAMTWGGHVHGHDSRGPAGVRYHRGRAVTP